MSTPLQTAINTTATVTLGGQNYVAQAVTIGKLINTFKSMSGAIQGLTEINPENIDEAIGFLTENASSAIENFLRTFIPTLPDGVLLDEEKGATTPELIEALSVITKLNRFDSIGNFIKGLGVQEAIKKALQ